MARDPVEQVESASGNEEDLGYGNSGDKQRPQVSMGLQEEQHTDPSEGRKCNCSTAGEEEEDPLETFRPLLSHLRLERLSELAISLKRAPDGGESRNIPDLTCTVNPRPLTGCYNVLYRVTFSDSSAWLFKFPSIGYMPVWSEASGRKLRSEAKTMSLIRKRTSIPVPKVFAFDSGLDNIINSPYIAMEFVNGIPMHKRWYPKEGMADNLLEEQRRKWLETLAEFSFQLGQFTFDKCGMLEFKDDEDWPTSIGPCSVHMEIEYQLQKLLAEPVPYTFRELGPFSDTKAYLLGLLDMRTSGRPTDELDRMLRQLILWIPDSIANAQLNRHRFVLTHPDFDLQNVIISNDSDCRILSIIDWDGVGTSPLCCGNERYPHWITCDWDPLWYRYDPEDPTNSNGHDSPAQLQRYREIFATSMQRLVGSEREAFTRYSHVYEALEMAAKNMYSYPTIVDDLSERSIEASGQNGLGKEQDEVLPFMIMDALAEDLPEPASVAMVERFRKGFLKLCGQEGYQFITLTNTHKRIIDPYYLFTTSGPTFAC